MPKTKPQSGFTLIETVMYLALFAIVIGGGMIATYGVIESSNAGYNHIVLQEEANFLLRKIDWALTGATSVSSPPPTSSLIVNKNINGVSTQLSFIVSGTDLTLKRGVGLGLGTTLNSSGILVSGVTFQKTSIGTGVITTFTLKTKLNGRNTTQTFSTTKYLRQ